MEDNYELNACECLKGALTSGEDNISIIISSEKYLCILVNSMQSDYKNKLSEVNIINQSILLLTLAEEKSGFKDRMFNIKDKEYEVVLVEFLLRSLYKIPEIDIKLITPTSLHSRKNSIDPDDLTSNKETLIKAEKVFIDRDEKVVIFKQQRHKKIQPVLLSYSDKLSKWLGIFDNTVFHTSNLSLSDFYPETFPQLSKESIKSSLEFLTSIENPENLIKKIQSFTLIGEVSIPSQPVIWTGIIENSKQNPCLSPLDAQKLYTEFSIPFQIPSLVSTSCNLGDFYASLSALYTQIYYESQAISPESTLIFIIHDPKIQGIEEDKKDENENNNENNDSQKVLGLYQIPNPLVKVYDECKNYLIDSAKAKIKVEDKEIKTKISETGENLGIGEAYEKIISNVKAYIEKTTNKSKEENKSLIIEEIKEESHIIKNGIPIIAICSFGCKAVGEVAERLGYKILQMKRSLIIQPNTIYVTDEIDEPKFLEKKFLLLALNWSEECQESFKSSIENLDKSKLPSSLLGYSKKKAKEAFPKIDDIFSKTRSKLAKLESLNPEYIIYQLYSGVSNLLPLLANKIRSLPEFSIHEEEKIAAILTEDPPLKSDLILNSPVCIILIPLGIPGMGKTYIAPIIQKYVVSEGFEYFKVSSDEIRNECIKSYQKKNLNCDIDIAFKKTAAPAKKMFYNALSGKIHSNKGKLFIYCDKNHAPDGLKAFHKNLKTQDLKSCKIKYIGLAPLCKKIIDLPYKKFEFSMELLVACMVRVITREKHLTLSGNNTKILGIVLAMLNLHKNSTFDRIIETGLLDDIIKIPFADEDYEIKSKNLLKILNEKIKFLKSDIEMKCKELGELAEEIENIKDIPDFDNSESIHKELSRIFKEVGNFVICPQIAVASTDEMIKKDLEEKKSKKVIEKYQGKKQRQVKMPVFLGLAVEQAIENKVISLAIDALNRFKATFHERNISQDIEELEKFRLQQQSRWSYPNSLHVTTMFIGGNTSKLETEDYKSFKEGDEFDISLTHLAYCPGGIICAKAQVSDAKPLSIENKIPHLTLLICSKPPKYSSTILQNAKLEEKISKNTFKDGKFTQTVYCLQFDEPINIIGISKSY